MTKEERNAQARAKRAMDKALKGAFRVREPDPVLPDVKLASMQPAITGWSMEGGASMHIPRVRAGWSTPYSYGDGPLPKDSWQQGSRGSRALHSSKSRALRAARQAVEKAAREALAHLDLAIAEAEAEETPAKDKP